MLKIKLYIAYWEYRCYFSKLICQKMKITKWYLWSLLQRKNHLFLQQKRITAANKEFSIIQNITYSTDYLQNMTYSPFLYITNSKYNI